MDISVNNRDNTENDAGNYIRETYLESVRTITSLTFIKIRQSQVLLPSKCRIIVSSPSKQAIDGNIVNDNIFTTKIQLWQVPIVKY